MKKRPAAFYEEVIGEKCAVRAPTDRVDVQDLFYELGKSNTVSATMLNTP